MKSHAIIFTTLLSAAACFWLLPRAQAVVPPRMEVYAGFNTAEGQMALFGLTTGTGNVAVGWASLYSDAEGSLNTAMGKGTLLFNTADQNTATAQERFYSTIVVQTIRETGHLRCTPMPPARKMQPLVLTRFTRMTRMQPVWPTTTRHLALLPSNLTLMAVRTRRWAQGRDKT